MNSSDRVLVVTGALLGDVEWWTESTGLEDVPGFDGFDPDVDMNEAGMTVWADGNAVLVATPGGSVQTLDPGISGTALEPIIDDNGTVKATIDQGPFSTAPTVVWVDSVPQVYPETASAPLLADEVDESLVPAGMALGSFETNASGVFVGSVVFENQTQAAVFDPGGGLTILGTLPDHVESVARAVNDAGDVVGYSEATDGSRRAVLWTLVDGVPTATDLGTLPGHTSSEALEINDAGFVVGFSDDGSGQTEAVLWRRSPPVQDLELSISPDEVEPVLTSGWDAKTRSGSSGTTLPDEVSVIVMVRDGTGGPTADATVELVATRLDGTGGHAHVHPAPPHGFLSGGAENSIVTLMTDANGRIEVPYRTTGVAGLEEIEARLIDPAAGGGAPIATASDTVLVRLQLVPLEASSSIDLVGATGSHPQNHFGTAATIATVGEVADAFLAERGKKLPVNDMSLEWGGVFDCRQLDTSGCRTPNDPAAENPWGPPHSTHRTGIQVDFSILNDRRVPDSRSLRQIITEIAENVLFFDRETSHTHVTFFPR